MHRPIRGASHPLTAPILVVETPPSGMRELRHGRVVWLDVLAIGRG